MKKSTVALLSQGYLKNAIVAKRMREFTWQYVCEISCILLLLATGSIAQSNKIILSPEQIKQYKAGLSNPDIKIIRNFVNVYLDPNKRKSLQPEVFGEIVNHDVNELKGLFILIEANDFLLGGKIYTIMFQNPPNTMLVVWVKEGSVKFVFDKQITPEAKKYLIESVSEFLKSPEYGV